MTKPLPSPLLFLAVFASVVFIAAPASAGCYSYGEAQADCSGEDGCTGTYTYSTCEPGCFAGTCDPFGNSGSCCNKPYYNAQIDPDGGICHGGDCDESSFRPHARGANAAARRNSVFRRDYTPGFAMLTPQLSYRDPQLVYVYDRCSRSYALVLQDGKILARGGN